MCDNPFSLCEPSLGESSEESKKMESVLAIFSNIQTFNFSTVGLSLHCRSATWRWETISSVYHPKYYGRSLPLLQEQGSLWHRCPQLYEHSRFYLSWPMLIIIGWSVNVWAILTSRYRKYSLSWSFDLLGSQATMASNTAFTLPLETVPARYQHGSALLAVAV